MSKRIITNNQMETIALGHRVAGLLQQGIILLSGDLGTGKTTFTKGIGTGLGITEIIKSPTFVIMKEYDDKLYHFDFYRLVSEIDDYDLLDYINDETKLRIIEWGTIRRDLLPLEYLEIQVVYLTVHKREFKFIPSGDLYQRVVDYL